MKNLKVDINDEVSVGTRIGTMSGIGSAGTVAFDSHLHVEVQNETSTNKTGCDYQVSPKNCDSVLENIYQYI